jgi:DDE family transposase
LSIDNRVQAYLALRQPVISVDTKKKELAGDFKNAGQDWRPNGSA